ncbi:hypothetical protein ACOMCU_01615 [Lysinibacillus sp. UGB7]|uniref:hypothetical protein n=1 Tax=Lysinibacillus sp. UGB7 TaxID=3411039 RepID=UPI003B77588D
MFYQVDEKLLNKLLLEGKRSIIVVAKKSVPKTAHSFTFIQGKQYNLFIVNGITDRYVQAQVESGSREQISVHGEMLKLMSKYEGTFLWCDNPENEKFYVEVELELKPSENPQTFAVEWNREDLESKVKILTTDWIDDIHVKFLIECRGLEDLKLIYNANDRLYWSSITKEHASNILIDVDLAEYIVYNS